MPEVGELTAKQVRAGHIVEPSDDFDEIQSTKASMNPERSRTYSEPRQDLKASLRPRMANGYCGMAKTAAWLALLCSAAAPDHTPLIDVRLAVAGLLWRNCVQVPAITKRPCSGNAIDV